jgi:hypothetical protein
MFNSINILKQNKKLIRSIIENCSFEDNYVYKNKTKNLIGIKMIFDDSSTAMLWISSNKNIVNYQIFNTIISLKLNKKQTQIIVDKFLNTFNQYYQFIDV